MKKPLRKIRIDGNGIAYVPLTKGYEAIIDEADAALVGQWNWYACVEPHGAYAQRWERINGKPKMVSMHRMLMGQPQGLVVDHIDCNTLNNRRSNLRAITKAQNAKSTKLRSNNKSGYKGVSLNKDSGKWRAQIQSDGVVYRLGDFANIEDAVGAYARASEKLHKIISPTG